MKVKFWEELNVSALQVISGLAPLAVSNAQLMVSGMEMNATVTTISTWKINSVLDVLQIQSTIHKQELATVKLQHFCSMEIV